LCIGQSATLSAGGAFSYSWNGIAGASQKTISPINTITYTLNGQSLQGCSGTLSPIMQIVVHPNPTVSVSGNTLICSGVTSTLVATGASNYSWTNIPGSSATITVAPIATSNYSVGGFDANGCSAAAFITVNVNPSPSLTISGNTTLCAGAQTTLSASGANSYTWTNFPGSSGSISVAPVSSSNFTVTGSNSNGCSASSVVVVTVKPLPTLTVIGNTPVCAGMPLTLSGSGANSYTFTGGVQNNVPFTPASSGNYTVSGDLNGCTQSKTINVEVNALPVLIVSSNPSMVCEGKSMTLTAGGANSYLWSTGASVAETSTIAAAGMQLTLTGTSSANCTSTLVFAPNVQVCAGNSEITVKYFSIFPNPAKGALYIKSDIGNVSDTGMKAEILDMLGQRVFEFVLQAQEKWIDLQNLKSGMYIIKCYTGSQLLHQEKLMIE
jgi:hypothetical protein